MAPVLARIHTVNTLQTPSLVLSYPEAAGKVSQHARLCRSSTTESLPLLRSPGRVLAAPVVADRPQPPFARSTRDGFACRASDLVAGNGLRVLGGIRAGEMWPGKPLAAGEAIEIMTGAPVPVDADCVVMVEHVTHTEAGIRMEEGRSIHAGENIVPMGAEAAQGESLVAAGARIGARQLAAAAACGYTTLEVYRRPRVAILSTGDELVDIGSVPLPQQIRNSNSYSLAAQVLEAGGEPVILPIVRDDRSHLESAIHTALDFDLLLLSGGVSMGKYDLVEPVLLDLGAEFFFTGVKIQPGRPVVFGRMQGKYFFGLPGNPVSTMVTFSLFAVPLLGAMCGQTDQTPRFAQAVLTADLKSKTGLTRFLPAVLTPDITAPAVTPLRWQGSGDLASAARANCFLVVPPDREILLRGEAVSVLLV